MITIHPKKVGLILLFAVVLPALIAFVFFTRFNYIPVQLTLGECRMDYTAKPTYEDRISPLESEKFQIKGWEMLICYGQPSLRGREMIGERIPLNNPWRFGANEPTRFYTTADVELGGVFVPKGRYSLYAVPGRFEWEIFINKSISHWGNDFSAEVIAQNLGSFKVTPTYQLDEVESLIFHAEEPELGEDDLVIYMEWENTLLEIPIKNLEEKDKTDRSLKGLIKKYSEEAEDAENTVDPILPPTN